MDRIDFYLSSVVLVSAEGLALMNLCDSHSNATQHSVLNRDITYIY